jgi:predicted XRE-type DNA-binding protein
MRHTGGVSEPPRPGEDPVLDAAKELGSVIRASVASWMRVLERIEVLHEERGAGTSWPELLESIERPTIVEILSENQEQVTLAGVQFRRAVARMLAEHGMSQAEIAGYFKVSRQRVAALLSDDPQDVPQQR